MPAGRPSSYKPEYCTTVQELGAEGESLTAMAVEIGVHRDTLYEWMDKHPEFSDAMKLARLKAQRWWEKILRNHATGEVSGNATSTIFAMKNQFPDDYRDRKEYDVKAEVGIFEIDFTGYGEDDEDDSQN